jgi:hypothetical protein
MDAISVVFQYGDYKDDDTNTIQRSLTRPSTVHPENLLVAQLASFHFFIHYLVQNSLTLGLKLNQLHPVLIFTP